MPVPLRRPPPLLLGAGLLAFAIALAAALGAALGRWPVEFDRAILLGLRHWGGPPWLRNTARDVTALGSGAVLTFVVLAAAGLLFVQRHRLTAAALVAAALSGSLLVSAIKAWFGRPRPTLVEHWAVVDHASFPSGHSASSAVIYLTLAALAAQVMPGRAPRTYILAVAILLVGAIGVSRVYLGVHWPSDVIGGWSLGTLWALGWWQLTARARASLRGGQ